MRINFDNFLFYPSRPYFPNELFQKDIIVLPPLDPILHSGLSGKEAVRSVTLPNDFTITLAASEPDVVCPISFAMDSRGRLWVVQADTYPVPAPERKGKIGSLFLKTVMAMTHWIKERSLWKF